MFSAVVADAAMVDRVIGIDVEERAVGSMGGSGVRGGYVGMPEQWEIEGIGGRLWYELAR